MEERSANNDNNLVYQIMRMFFGLVLGFANKVSSLRKLRRLRRFYDLYLDVHMSQQNDANNLKINKNSLIIHLD